MIGLFRWGVCRALRVWAATSRFAAQGTGQRDPRGASTHSSKELASREFRAQIIDSSSVAYVRLLSLASAATASGDFGGAGHIYYE